jgi:cyclase
MLRYRIIPTLLLKGDGLVKTVQFKNPKYIGDPINAVKIFNEKEVDELIIYDILATKNKQEIRYHKIEEIVSEAFMPVGYGGGIHSLDQIEKLFSLGVEKIVLNSSAHTNKNLITQAAQVFGSQSIVVAVDVKKDFFGKYRMYYNSGIEKSSAELMNALKQFVELGAGEIIINSIDRDGTMRGYDLDLIKLVNEVVTVPFVVSGGAGNINHFSQAIKAGASAVAAGSMFVFHGKHRAVLISYPKYSELEDKLI